MSNIPSKEKNPKGLHKRYVIFKIDDSGDDLIPVDKHAEYFVLRLDKNGSDPKHIEACRKAVLTYAVNIEPHLPELAKDLIERYNVNKQVKCKL